MPGQTRTLTWVPKRVGCLPVLLHRLLLGAAPGDAGLHPGLAAGIDGRAEVRTAELQKAQSQLTRMTGVGGAGR